MTHFKTITTEAIRQLNHARTTRRKVPSRITALLETMESRILLSGVYSAADLSSTLALIGLNKTGSLTFDGISAITAGGWTNQSGPPATTVIPPSTYTVQSAGQVALSLTTEPTGSVVTSSSTLTGTINATRDIVALNETVSGTPSANGLDLLVNHSGIFATTDLGGLWNIAAQNFRGTVTINSSGHITGGLIRLQGNQHSASVTGGTAVLNADGTGTLTINTKFTGGDSAFATISLALTMNSAKDTVVANAATLGDGNTPNELTVLVKSSGKYAASDVVGSTWAINAALGAGSITFQTHNKLTGTLTDSNGTVHTISGNFQLGGNGTLIANLFFTHAGITRRESLFGALNRSKNLMALDRAIANGQAGSSLTILTSAANHAPTERLTAVLPLSAYLTSAYTIDFPTLITASSAHDLDHDTLSFLITDVPAASGTLTITHNGITTDVIPGTTLMVNGDTLTWTAAATTARQLNAFSIRATDGTDHSANATHIFVATSALPIVTAISTHGNALEAKAGTAGGNATIQLTRSGGQKSQALTITMGLGGTAQQGVNYQLLGTDGTTLITTPTFQVTFPANQTTITLTVSPLDDGIVDPTLTVLATVQPDPNTAAPAYAPSIHPTAHVNILDANPTVSITPVVRSVVEGDSNVVAFFVERLPAQGGNINGSLTVNLNYSNSTFDVGDLIAPSSVTFNPGEVKKRIVISTQDDGQADPLQTIVATISGAGFSKAPGERSASVKVIDGAPIVRIMTLKPIALEGKPADAFGSFVVFRSGSTTDALTVDFTTGAGPNAAILGTNYSLTDSLGHPLTTSITIPAGTDHIAVQVTPIDDFKNDPTLRASVTLVADSAPTYHVGAATSVIQIINNPRFPTLANTNILETTPMNTDLHLTFATLQTDTGSALDPAEIHGTLQFKVVKVLAGTLKVFRSGALTPVAAHANTIINAGDELIWSPPTGLTATALPAFTLSALDGTLTSLNTALIRISIS